MAGSVSVDGLISGLDTKSIIEQLIAIQTSRITRLTDKQATQTQKANIFQTLQANYLGIRTAANALKSPILFNARSVSSSNTDILTATASDTAAIGSHQFTVVQLATSHQFMSGRFADKTISTGVTGDLKITVGTGATAITTTVTLTSASNSLEEIRDAINNSGAKVKASILQVDNSTKPFRLVVTAKDPGSVGKVSVSFNNSAFVSIVTDEQAGPGAGADTAATADLDGKTLAFATARPNPGTAVTVKIGATAGTAAIIQPKLAAPAITSVANANAGGNLIADTTFYYKVTALDASGETVGSETASINTGDGGNDQTNTVTWGAVAGATSYKLYFSLNADFSGSMNVGTTAATTLAHTDMGNAGTATAGAPPAAATQGYAIDFETGTVRFNQAQNLSSRTADTAAVVRGGDGTTTDANRFTINFAFKEDGTALATGAGSSAEALATLLKSAGLTAEPAGAGKIEIDLATDSFDTTAKLTVTTKNSGFTTLDQLVGAINNSSLGKVLKAENVAGSLKLTAQFNGVFFKAADADLDTVEVGTPNTGFDNAATLSAAASKVFLSYQHGGLLFSESQAVRDAIIKLGAGDSATTVTKNSNTVTDLVEGVTLELKKADPSATVTVNVTRNTQGVTGAVSSLVKAVNETEALIQKNTFFDSNTNETGALFSDSNLFIVRSRVSGILTGVVESIPVGKLRALRDVGVSLSADTGNYSVDSSKLSSLLSEKPDEVRNLFASVALASDGDIKALTFTDKTKTSTSAGYDLQITQAATRATDEGKQNVSAGLTQNETLAITVGGAAASVSLTSGMTAEQATSAINSALQSAGITSLTASFNSTTGKITIRHNSYGAKFSFTVKSSLANGTAGSTGLGGATADAEVLFIGRDVAGTINGEAATGEGQTLTGNTGNASTEGLQLLVELTPDQLAEQGSSQGTVTVSRGVASRLEEFLAFLTDPNQDGPIQGAIEEANKRVEDLQSQIDAVNARIERERLRLSEQFARLEQALGTLQTTSAFLSRQLAQISANSASLASSSRK